MKIALTGASGLVGRAILPPLQLAGHEVVTLGRHAADRPYALGAQTPDISDCDALVHAAFAHEPGKYRGGEGNDPDGFVAMNQHGSNRLFSEAAAQGVPRLIFLSSRAVYGDYPAGTELTEDLTPRPDTLYGQVKLNTERHLQTLDAHTASLRATGVYAPGPHHKWRGLFGDYLLGKTIEPRCATELHAADLARAILRACARTGHAALNVSDITLDRHTLLSEVKRLTGCAHPPPQRSDVPASAMTCTTLAALGWHPGGLPLLKATLPELLP